MVYDLYLLNVLQFDFFCKRVIFQNLYFFLCFEFKYYLLHYNLSNQLYSKVYYIIRNFSYNLNYQITKIKVTTKKKNKIYGFLLQMLFKNLYDFIIYFDFFRFFFVRFLFIYKQLFGIGFFLKNIFKNNIQKLKYKQSYLKIYFNDLTFRVNNLMDSLLNRENFIYFFENINLFYSFIFSFFNFQKFFKIFFSFFGFFLINYKKFVKRYKFFVFYTIII